MSTASAMGFRAIPTTNTRHDVQNADAHGMSMLTSNRVYANISVLKLCIR